jgi:hypothetical protein
MTAAINRVVVAWRAFWFTPVPPHVYALLRIALGLSGCAIILTRTDIAAFWDLSGFVPLESGRATDLKQWLVAQGWGNVAGRLVLAGVAVSFVTMTLGLWSRVTVPLAFVAALVMQAWNYLPMTGADGALRAFLFCLMWADSGAVWSIDAWRRGTTGDMRPETTAIAPLRLMRFQLAVIYLSAGLYKIDSPIWRNGTAVYYVLNSNVHQRIPYFVAPEYGFISTLLTYTTLLWELGFAFLILFRPTRLLALLLGVGIHIGMFSFMEVGPFHLVMLSSYVAFLNPERVPTLFRRFRRSYTAVAGDHSSVAPAGSASA